MYLFDGMPAFGMIMLKPDLHKQEAPPSMSFRGQPMLGSSERDALQVTRMQMRLRVSVRCRYCSAGTVALRMC